MRFFLGLIIGVALTIGGAYVVDNMNSGPGARPMVNWDVVGDNMRIAQDRVREAWTKIAHKVTS